jgi:hypothetical protein
MVPKKISWINKVRPNGYNLDHLFGFWREWDVMLAVRQMNHPDVICLPAIVMFLGENIMVHMFGERDRSAPDKLKTIAYQYKYEIVDGEPLYIQAREILFHGDQLPELGELEKFDWGLFSNDLFSMRFADQIWHYENTTWEEILAMGFPEQPALKYLDYFTDAGHRIPMRLHPKIFEEIVRKRLYKRGYTEEDIKTMGEDMDIDGYLEGEECEVITLPDEVRDAIEKLSEVPGLERKDHVVGLLEDSDEVMNQPES